MSSKQTFTDDQKREIALRMAVQVAREPMTAADLVAYATSFHEFLTGADSDQPDAAE